MKVFLSRVATPIVIGGLAGRKAKYGCKGKIYGKYRELKMGSYSCKEKKKGKPPNSRLLGLPAPCYPERRVGKPSGKSGMAGRAAFNQKSLYEFDDGLFLDLSLHSEP